MIAGYHLIWTAYGHWLPNDPRGSASQLVRSPAIAELGKLHRGVRPVEPTAEELRRFYASATTVLKHESPEFNDEEFRLIAASFAMTILIQRYTCYACAIMPDHVHLLIRKHRHKAEQMIEQLQSKSRAALIQATRRPSDHPVWVSGGWKVYLETPEDILRTIEYIEKNPIVSALPPQSWDFVRKYDYWMPGIGAPKKTTPDSNG